jgi:hypothetical protein
MSTFMNVEAALQQLRVRNDSDPLFAQMRQRLDPPATCDEGIPTLATGVYKRTTPMLEARFRFAGTWNNAFPGMKWLSCADMKRAWKSRSVRKQINLRREHWPSAKVTNLPDERLSLFGLDANELMEVYLLWPKDGGAKEPAILWYTSGEEKSFPNFLKYILHLLSLD